MDDYTTVFVFTDKIPDIFEGSQDIVIRISMIAFSIFVTIAFSFLILALRNRYNFWAGPFRSATVVWTCGGLIIFIIGGLNYWVQRIDYQNLADAYTSHQYQVAEGTVHVLHAQAAGCHDTPDTLNIGLSQIEISYCDNSFGYTSTIAHGGALKEGTYARVFYLQNYGYYGTILRVDVRDSNE